MNKVQEALKAAIEAMEYHTEQTRPIQKTIDTIAECKSALAEIGECEPVINLNILKYTEHGVIPDDFKGQASGYRAGWNDCLSSVQYMFSQPIDKCAPVYLIVSGADEIVVTKEKYDSWTSAKRISYTSPISKEWLGLSDQQIQNLIINSDNYNKFQFIKSVEHTVKQLNAEKG